MPGATNINGTPFDGLLADLGGETGVATLRNAGYNVVTWDPRGEYASGGVFEIDSPYAEARDVSAIMNWLAEQPETQLDGPGDPSIGMVGASYGGGIQPVTAAVDHRVDAIVPTIGWNTLNSMIYPNGAFKTASGAALAATLVFTLAQANPRILPAVIHGDLTGEMSPADQDLLAERGPGPVRGFPDLVAQISAPTLLIQGTVDTLTALNQADMTARALLAQGVPTKVLWFCGGHGLCINPLFDPDEGALIQQRTVEWLDRYVKREPVSTGPGFEWVDQRGQRLSTDSYGTPSGPPIVASRSGVEVLRLIPFVAGSGPMFLVLPFGGTKAFNAINLATPASPTTAYVAGAPQLTFSYSGTGSGSHVYAQLLDTTTGLVLGNQVTPIPVALDGQTHTVNIPLQPVAHTLLPGQTVSLQLFSWAAEYAGKPALGELRVSDIAISLPTVSNPSIGYSAA
jgi:ABC-2 type transport system ATP-binding protein